MSREEEVGDHADGPHVAALVVTHALEVVHVHLGRDVVARAHQTVHVVRAVHELAISEGERSALCSDRNRSASPPRWDCCWRT